MKTPSETKKILSDFARKGGLTTKKKYGVGFYKKISKLGVGARKVKRKI
jgi:hypothetical protein